MQARRIIVTDLTRFRNDTEVCCAGIDTTTFECIRPLPYLGSKRCQELNLQPGAILTGKFAPTHGASAPHVEDMDYQDLDFNGPCESSEFRAVLVGTCASGVLDGFGVVLPDGERCIPREQTPSHSIITLRLEPENVEIVPDGFNQEKIKLHFTDMMGTSYRYMPITDLGFYNYAAAVRARSGDLNDVNEFIASQDELFLRVGLSRYYDASNGRAGFWMQANGIYTFPGYREDIRSYG